LHTIRPSACWSLAFPKQENRIRCTGLRRRGEYNEAALGGILECSSDELARLAELCVIGTKARAPDNTRKKSAS